MRFGSPNHWFCRTTEPDRTSGSAELPNRTESSVVHYLTQDRNAQKIGQHTHHGHGKKAHAFRSETVFPQDVVPPVRAAHIGR